jgi:two-component system cell cycle sensor histidine kinase/response regulator CckA
LLHANPAICRMLGYAEEELLKLGIKDIHPPQDLPRVIAEFEAQARGEKILASDIPCLRKDGTTFYADVCTACVRIEGRLCNVGFFTDTTKRRHLEEQIRRVQKLEAIGQLAGGVAHEFNNLLMGIGGCAQMLLAEAEPGSGAARDLGRIRELTKRGAGLTKDLLLFSRRDPPRREALNLNSVAEGVHKMVRHLLPENIAMDVRLAPHPASVMADSEQMKHVLINLAVNARDAMPEGGRLILEVRNVELDSASAQTGSGLAPGRYVVMAVTDTGCGMDQATRQRIFEPFFTTKDIGSGTGLGLATVFGIVREHDGQVTAYSEPGQGTTFKVYLPRLPENTAASARREPEAAASGGAETILLVEDEEAVRAVLHSYLTKRGYVVLAASGPEEAATVFQQAGGAADLLLTDMAMPGMSGDQLYRRLAGTRPGLKVLFMSGHPEGVIRHEHNMGAVG